MKPTSLTSARDLSASSNQGNVSHDVSPHSAEEKTTCADSADREVLQVRNLPSSASEWVGEGGEGDKIGLVGKAWPTLHSLPPVSLPSPSVPVFVSVFVSVDLRTACVCHSLSSVVFSSSLLFLSISVSFSVFCLSVPILPPLVFSSPLSLCCLDSVSGSVSSSHSIHVV